MARKSRMTLRHSGLAVSIPLCPQVIGPTAISDSLSQRACGGEAVRPAGSPAARPSQPPQPENPRAARPAIRGFSGKTVIEGRHGREPAGGDRSDPQVLRPEAPYGLSMIRTCGWQPWLSAGSLASSSIWRAGAENLRVIVPRTRMFSARKALGASLLENPRAARPAIRGFSGKTGIEGRHGREPAGGCQLREPTGPLGGTSLCHTRPRARALHPRPAGSPWECASRPCVGANGEGPGRRPSP